MDLIILTKLAFMNCFICASNSSRKILEEFVGKSSSLNLLGTFGDSVSMSSQLSERNDIDLIFLDVETPDMDISDFINGLNYRANIIIISVR